MCPGEGVGDPSLSRPYNPDKPEWLLQFFAYKHLPDHLQEVSHPFSVLAHQMVAVLPRNPERTAGLRKLLEAKDCAVRAVIGQE